MNIELLIGAVVIIVVVAYLLLRDNKSETPLEPTLQADKVEAEKQASVIKKKPAKKTTKKKTATKQKKLQDETLNAMTKKELLEVAKVHGIKANASLSKSELVDRVKNG